MFNRPVSSTMWIIGVVALLTAGSSVLSQEQRSASRAAQIQLPEPKTSGGMSLTEALAKRRTQRTFTDRALSLEQISQLCWAAQGITEPTKGLRTAPSAGALYPITVYLIDRNGVFEYMPKQHALHRRIDGDIRTRSQAKSLGRSYIRSASVCVLLTMDVSRCATKFSKDAERYCLLEAGHVAQNVLLQATALGLAGIPVGGLEEKDVATALDLPGRLRPVYLLPVGYPAPGTAR